MVSDGFWSFMHLVQNGGATIKNGGVRMGMGNWCIMEDMLELTLLGIWFRLLNGYNHGPNSS